MREKMARFIPLLLCLCLLSGCAAPDFSGYVSGVSNVLRSGSISTEPAEDYVRYEDMEYIRPDTAVLDRILEETLQAAEDQDLRRIMDGVYRFYDEYDWFYTCHSLADLHCSADLTDEYWSREYAWCMEHSADVDAALEALYYGLAASPSREKLEDPKFFGPGFFDDYTGDSQWDETFTALLEQEAALISRYYDLSEEALAYGTGTEALYDACGENMAQLLVELIRVRQEMASYFGYEDYTHFAWDFTYYRDFTPEDAQALREDIRKELVPLYRTTAEIDAWDRLFSYCSEDTTFAYLKGAAGAMGGRVWEAFDLLEKAGLYDIGYSKNKYIASFAVYLTSYSQPFVFMNPELSHYDCLTFSHEFGHFCNDFASRGSYADVDLSEFFSQGMEYLSLFYAEDGPELVQGKLADSLAIYVEQAAFSEFEDRMYHLTGDELCVQGLCRLYEEVALSYGFDSVGYDPREFIETVHYYTNPMYIISYVVSNDAAMQLYQLERSEAGSGLALYDRNLNTRHSMLLPFLEEVGLESPFAPGHMESVRETFSQIFG